MRIGLDQFSFHRLYGDVFPQEEPSAERWTLTEFLDFARARRIHVLGLHTHYFKRGETGSLGAIGEDLILEWGHPDGLRMGTSPQAVRDLEGWLGVAAGAGCRLVRFVAGYPTWRGLEPVRVQIDRLKPILRRLADAAAEKGITLAIENHADFTPAELMELLSAVDRKALRICFDTGNCVRVGADLLASARLVAGYTAMVHLKDLKIVPASIGDPKAYWPSAPLGQGSFDLPAVIAAMEGNGFSGPWLIELAQMHPDCPSEFAAIDQSLEWLGSRHGRP